MTERSTVKSARRVLEILELFAQGLRQATVMDVANALTYPQSSTTALLSTLTTLGFLRFDPTDRTYSPTLRVMLLGSWMQDELFGEGSLVATMEHLRQLTRQTPFISSALPSQMQPPISCARSNRRSPISLRNALRTSLKR